MSKELEMALETEQYDNMEYTENESQDLYREIDLAYQVAFAEVYDY